jgi:pilus assembly protein CpaC
MTVPGLRTREVDTGVDLRAGQTLAIAGLVQTRLESETRGLPWLMDLPYIGVPFRRVESEENEIELLIMVTPELVMGMEQCEVPPGGPGLDTATPSDCELGLRGYIEVPKCCGPECGGALEPGLMGTPGVRVEGEAIPAPACGAPAGPAGAAPSGAAPAPKQPVTPPTDPNATRRPQQLPTRPAVAQPSGPQPSRQYSYNRPTPNRGGAATASSATPGLIGPQGYDVRN